MPTVVTGSPMSASSPSPAPGLPEGRGDVADHGRDAERGHPGGDRQPATETTGAVAHAGSDALPVRPAHARSGSPQWRRIVGSGRVVELHRAPSRSAPCHGHSTVTVMRLHRGIRCPTGSSRRVPRNATGTTRAPRHPRRRGRRRGGTARARGGRAPPLRGRTRRTRPERSRSVRARRSSAARTRSPRPTRCASIRCRNSRTSGFSASPPTATNTGGSDSTEARTRDRGSWRGSPRGRRGPGRGEVVGASHARSAPRPGGRGAGRPAEQPPASPDPGREHHRREHDPGEDHEHARGRRSRTRSPAPTAPPTCTGPQTGAREPDDLPPDGTVGPSSCPASYRSRAAVRRTLPLDVFGTAPGPASTTSSGAVPATSLTRR
jgi:hypothetical protein